MMTDMEIETQKIIVHLSTNALQKITDYAERNNMTVSAAIEKLVIDLLGKAK
jgi:macrodomain Ter protein organizer (MatP/YcbG family)